jgi:hypothetical protein
MAADKAKIAQYLNSKGLNVTAEQVTDDDVAQFGAAVEQTVGAATIAQAAGSPESVNAENVAQEIADLRKQLAAIQAGSGKGDDSDLVPRDFSKDARYSKYLNREQWNPEAGVFDGLQITEDSSVADASRHFQSQMEYDRVMRGLANDQQADEARIARVHGQREEFRRSNPDSDPRAIEAEMAREGVSYSEAKHLLDIRAAGSPEKYYEARLATERTKIEATVRADALKMVSLQPGGSLPLNNSDGGARPPDAMKIPKYDPRMPLEQRVAIGRHVADGHTN